MSDKDVWEGFRELLASPTVPHAERQASILETFDKAIAYLNSEEYHQMQTERYLHYEAQLHFIDMALQQKIITEQEFFSLLYQLEMFGSLTVSPQMGERLNNVVIVDPEIQERTVNLPEGFYLLHTQDDLYYAWNASGMVYTRFSGPYPDEMAARLWCVEQHEIQEVFRNAPERGKVRC